MIIDVKKFKKKYLYFNKKYINKNICDILNIYENKIDNNLINSLKRIFPYLGNNEANLFIKYIQKSNIEYSNRFKFILDISLFSEYMDELSDDRIKVDLQRLSFTKNFIYQNGGKIKKHSQIQLIDTLDLDYMSESGVYFYDFNQLSNKTEFINNIMKDNKILKYLIHQDIHNSIINPILISIMLTKYFKNKTNIEPSIFQLDIKQIYKYINNNRNIIEILYFIKDYTIYDPIVSDIPKKYNINPYLLIKLEINITKNNLEIFITY